MKRSVSPEPFGDAHNLAAEGFELELDALILDAAYGSNTRAAAATGTT